MAIVRGVERPDEQKEEDEPKKSEEPKKPTALEEAKEINERKAELLDREEALQKKKEDFAAEEMVGGRASAGGTAPEPEKETPHEYRIRIEKEMAEGKTEFGD